MPYKEKKVEKLYYPIGEVSEMLGVPISTVRFWENEFEVLKPMKNKKVIPPQKVTLLKKIKVRLDYKTIVIINRLSSFETWKRLYPEAKII